MVSIVKLMCIYVISLHKPSFRTRHGRRQCVVCIAYRTNRDRLELFCHCIQLLCVLIVIRASFTSQRLTIIRLFVRVSDFSDFVVLVVVKENRL